MSGASMRRKFYRNFATKAFRRPVDDRMVNRLAALAEGVYKQQGKSFEAGLAYPIRP